MNTYSIKFFTENKGWDKRGVRVIAKNSTEAIELAKIRKKSQKVKKFQLNGDIVNFKTTL